MNKQPYSFSIIICTYKRQKWVENLLKSISEQTVLPKEIIIVDASPEKIDYSISKGLKFSFIKSDKMQLTYQRNLGVKAARCDIIMHLDDDTYLEQDFIEIILEVFNNDTERKIGAVSGYVTNQWGLIEYKPGFTMKLAKRMGIYDGDFSPGSVSPSGIFIELNNLKPCTGIQYTEFISGCSFAVRSEVYNKYQHPEEINKYGGEDKAFSRMIAKDWLLCICGDATLEHFSAAGGARPSPYSHGKSMVHNTVFIQNNFGLKGISSRRLKIYYLFTSLLLFTVSIIFLCHPKKIKKFPKTFQTGLGIIAGVIFTD